MTKQKENKKKDALYTKQQITKSKKYSQYKDLLMSILQNGESYSSKEIDTIIKEFLGRKV